MQYKDLSVYEKTFIMFKPDTVQRGLIGELVTRIERKGLKIVALKMVWPTPERAAQHYAWPESDMLLLGNRTKESFAAKGIIDNRDPMDIARTVHAMLLDNLSAGPVIAIVVEGAHAVANMRKLRGKTNPLDADIGTFAGDFTIDSYELADAAGRAIRNLVHASGSAEEAKREIALWFTPEEVFDYDLAIEMILYSKDWEKSNKAKAPYNK